MIEDDDENSPTATVDEIRAAFGSVAAAIIDSHPPSPARQGAIEVVIRAHERVRTILATSREANQGVAMLWLRSRMH